MSLNFPANPNNGDTYTSGSITYIYQDPPGKWTASTQVNLDTRYVNSSGDTMTGDLTVPSLNSGPLSGFRNQIINGSFAVAQRSVDVTPPTDGNVAGYLTADRWFHSGSNQNIGRIVRDKVSSSIGAPPGFDYTLHFVDASKTSRSGFGQAIELPLAGQRGAFTDGSVWTLSFYVNIDASAKVVESLTFADNFEGGNSVTCGPNAGLSYTEIGSYANSWKRYSVTYTLNNTAPNATNTCVRVNLGTVTQSGQLAIAGVQLEPGSVATPFEQRPIGTELALCQRYYYAWAGEIQLSMNASNASVRDAWIPWAATMRAVPSISNVTLSLGAPGGTSAVFASGYLLRVGVGSTTASTAVSTVNADAEL